MVMVTRYLAVLYACSKTDAKTNAEKEQKRKKREPRKGTEKVSSVVFFSSSCGLLRAVCWILGGVLGGGEGREEKGGREGREGEEGREGKGREGKGGEGRKERRGEEKGRKEKAREEERRREGKGREGGEGRKKAIQKNKKQKKQEVGIQYANISQYSTVRYNGNEKKAFFYSTIAIHIYPHPKKKQNLFSSSIIHTVTKCVSSELSLGE